MFNDNNFDFVEFISWFENLIDFITKLIDSIKAKLTPTTTVPDAETTVETPIA